MPKTPVSEHPPEIPAVSPPIRIKNEEEFRGAEVRYSDRGFLPKNIDLSRQAPEDNCFIKIINESILPLTIRLSPHSPKDDRGFHYTPIPPAEALIIDPRYGTMENLSFHNHAKPIDEFSVTLDPICF